MTLDGCYIQQLISFIFPDRLNVHIMITLYINIPFGFINH